METETTRWIGGITWVERAVVGCRPLWSLESVAHNDTMPLTQDEIDRCRDAFLAFDKDRSGTIDVWELRQVLEAMGQKPTEEELFQMISEVDDNMSGSIDFGEFLKVSWGNIIERFALLLSYYFNTHKSWYLAWARAIGRHP